MGFTGWPYRPDEGDESEIIDSIGSNKTAHEGAVGPALLQGRQNLFVPLEDLKADIQGQKFTGVFAKVLVLSLLLKDIPLGSQNDTESLLFIGRLGNRGPYQQADKD